eukprot:m.252281 g.252281  ORF g.252281 m.252281 type:complete len:420 (+) comp19122_c0_seq1:96-1355(+)
MAQRTVPTRQWPCDQLDSWPQYATKRNLMHGEVASPGEGERGSQSSLSSAQPAGTAADNQLSAKIVLWRGDLVTLACDAIVNSAQPTLLGGAGLDGCVHRAAGPGLRRACSRLGRLGCGNAVITPGFQLPAKFVIHAVAPKRQLPAALASCYVQALQLCLDHNISTVAFPCLSSHSRGFPGRLAATIAMLSVKGWLRQHGDKIHRVVFCVFSERDEAIYQAMMGEFFPFSQSFGLASLMDSPKPGTGFVARTPFSKLFASVLPGAGGSRSTPSISTPLRMGHVKRTSAGQTPLRVGGKWSPIPEAAIDPPAIDPPAARGSCGSGSSALATAVVATTPMSASASASSPPLSQPVFDDVDMQDSPSPGANAHGCGSADNGGGGHFQQHHRASNGGRGQDTDSSFGDEADFDEEPPRRATWI